MKLKEVLGENQGFKIKCKANELKNELKKLELETFYFTFGVGQANAYQVQPIKANNMTEAHNKMFEVYGAEWAFSYTEADFEESDLINNYKRKTLIVA